MFILVIIAEIQVSKMTKQTKLNLKSRKRENKNDKKCFKNKKKEIGNVFNPSCFINQEKVYKPSNLSNFL